MKTEITYLNKKYSINLNQPIDVSILIQPNENSPRAWYVDPIKIEPVMENGFIGDVNLGGGVNFRNIFFNPHGNGTHTECVGHISKEPYHVSNSQINSFLFAELITVTPKQKGEDLIITKDSFLQLSPNTEAIVIRTQPNDLAKLSKNYSNTNPPFIEVEAIEYLINNGINHLLIDLPSIDKEQDGGKLAGHHAFWEYPENTNIHRTITEFIFVDNTIPDGNYFLNLQVAPFQNDASPSKPFLYRIEN